MEGRQVSLFLIVLIASVELRAQRAADRPHGESATDATPPALVRPAGEEAPACRRFGPPPGEHPPCFGVLSPEERRQLRRDIRQAGQELYFPRHLAPHPFGGPPLPRRD